MLIPRLFHWVWFGDGALPDQHRRWIDGWLAHHPGWEHVLWTDDNRPTFVNEREFLAAGSHAQRADIARYELVREHGGVYLDTDTECLRCIEPLLGGVEAFAVELDAHALETHALGATRGHPWLGEVIAALPEAFATGWSNMHRAGPGFLTSATLGRSDVTRIGRGTFATLRGDEPQRELVLDALRRSHAYSVHHAAWSWRAAGAAEHEAWLRRLVREDVEPVVPRGALFVLVDKGHGVEVSGGRRFVPFPEQDGEWAGYPADDEAAICELQRLIAIGASFIVIPAPMRYWLSTYPRWHEHLSTYARRVVDNDRGLVFALT